VEFGDNSSSLSCCYPDAIFAAGGRPLIMPMCTDANQVAEYVKQCDGVMLTGGDDVQPRLYAPELPQALQLRLGSIDLQRDLMEMLIIDAVFQQRKPLLAICRGQQILNVALGGTLYADIPTQVPNALDHRQPNRRDDLVHEVELTPGPWLINKSTQGTRLKVNSAHHQAVDKVAPPFAVVARSSDGIVEAMELKPDKQDMIPYLLAVQYHPERLYDRYPEHLELFRGFVKACNV
jgi:putative glutamine amidotransferase